ncbi:hypothetical protein MHYP_G00089750 [Metynnis hypsauchen]
MFSQRVFVGFLLIVLVSNVLGSLTELEQARAEGFIISRLIRNYRETKGGAQQLLDQDEHLKCKLLST